MLSLDSNQLMKLADLAGIKELSNQQKAKLNENYQEYLRPVTSKEDINKINNIIVNFVVDAKEINSTQGSEIGALIELLRANIQANPALRKDFSRILKYSNFVEKYGGTSKILLKQDVDNDLKNAKIEIMLSDLMSLNATDMTNILSDNLYNLETILKPVNYELYFLLRQKYNKKFNK